MRTHALILRASKVAKFAMLAAAATALSACWYYSRPTEGASGQNCQKTSYGLAILDTSNENCQPSTPPAAVPPAAAIPPPAPAPQ
ncbi:MAG: hypothetical protein ACYDC3_12730 [Candidatus Binataceae bacterium]